MRDSVSPPGRRRATGEGQHFLRSRLGKDSAAVRVVWWMCWSGQAQPGKGAVIAAADNYDDSTPRVGAESLSSGWGAALLAALPSPLFCFSLSPRSLQPIRNHTRPHTHTRTRPALSQSGSLLWFRSTLCAQKPV